MIILIISICCLLASIIILATSIKYLNQAQELLEEDLERNYK